MADDINGTYDYVTKGVAEDFGNKERDIKFNPDLSPEGRNKRIDKVKADRVKEIDKLEESYNIAFDKEMAVLEKKLNLPKESHADKGREILKNELIKAVNLGELDKRYVSLDDNARIATLLDAITNNHKEQVEIPKLQALGHRSEDWHRKEMSKAIENKDIEYLKQLHKSTDYMYDGDISDRLRSEYEGGIKRVESELLTPEQREAIEAKAKLEHSRALLKAEFQSVRERGQYMGYLHVKEEVPVNEIKLVQSSSGRVQPNQSYRRYK